MDWAEGTAEHEQLYATFSDTPPTSTTLPTLLLSAGSCGARSSCATTHRRCEAAKYWMSTPAPRWWNAAGMVIRGASYASSMQCSKTLDGARRSKPQAPRIPKGQQSKVLMRFSTGTLEQIRSQPNVGTELYNL